MNWNARERERKRKIKDPKLTTKKGNRMGCSIEFAIVLFCTHREHLDGMLYVIIYLKSRWWWRRQLPPPSNAHHLFWHSISPSLALSFKGNGRKNFVTFQQSLCRLINLMLYTEIQTHSLAFAYTHREREFRSTSSSLTQLRHLLPSSPTQSSTI